MGIDVDGVCDPAFKAVRDAFAANFADGLELGGSLSISVEGRNVVDVWGGWADGAMTRPWERDTLACVFSCTKGVVAVLALLLVEDGRLDLDAPVARYWPEFAQGGKAELPVRYLLTHEAGLPALSRPMPFGSLSDWDAMVTALAAQEPWWEPGHGHGYHGVTYGHLIGEVMRRITGTSVGVFLDTAIAGPLGVDLTMGLPEHEESRTADMVLGPMGGATFFDHWQPDGLGPKSFRNPPDCSDVGYTNTRAFRGAEIPAANGHGTARALDRMYAVLAGGGALDGTRYLSAELVAEGGREHVRGQDLVMDLPTAFGLGFERTIPEWRFGPNPNTYGHNGSGGSLGIVDPDTGVSLGYVMNRMVWGATRDDPRWPAIFDALYGAL
jgi:CubicO group peptidase (beta-lactamase class C family)